MRLLPSLTFGLAIATLTAGWSIHLRPSGERLQQKIVGENFLVVCSVVDYNGSASDVLVNWIYNNDVVRGVGRIMTIERVMSSQLMIVQAKKSDSGTYTCQAKIKGTDETQYSNAEISFIKAPKFVDPKTEQHPEEGTDAEIHCEVDGEDGVEIFWQFNGQTIGEATQRDYDFKNNKQILVIPRFEAKKDDGAYRCNAAQPPHFETLTINVTGYSRPSITVFETPENDQGLEGHATTFKCQAVGKPAPTYKWFKVPGDEEIMASDMYKVEDGLLTINSLTDSDVGPYKCVATNQVGSDEKTANLNVFLKPVVEKMKNEVKQDGEEITITCRFSGEGAVKAKFTVGNNEYSFGHKHDHHDDAIDDDEEDDEEKSAEKEGVEEEEKKEEDEANNENEEENEDEEKVEEKENHEDEHDEETTEQKEEDDEDKDDDNSEVSDEQNHHGGHDHGHPLATDLPEENESKEEGKEEENEEGENEDDEHEHKKIHIAPMEQIHIDHIEAILTEEDDGEDEVTPLAASGEDAAEDLKENESEEKKEGGEEEEKNDHKKDGDDEDDEEEEEETRWKRFVDDVSSKRIVVTEESGSLSLTIRHLSMEDAGDYKCIVENEAGANTRTASLAITHAPKILSHTEGPVRVVEGDEAGLTLECEVDAVPDATWKWMRNGNQIEADGVTVVIDSTAEKSKIIIQEPKDEHFGDFECIASNGVGEPAGEKIQVVHVVSPSTPPTPACTEYLYPNYGKCRFPKGSFESDGHVESSPTKIVFYFAPNDLVNDEFDWVAQAQNVTVEYSEETMRIPGLDTNKVYMARARAINEAGESELSPEGKMETTDPWAPETPTLVEVECERSCIVSWEEPNDQGSPISNYIITVNEMDEDEEGNSHVVNTEEHTPDADKDEMRLPGLKPSTHYEVFVAATNIIGQSGNRSATFETPADLSSSLPLSLSEISSPLVLALIVALFILAVLVDFLCCCINGCGVMACFWYNCLGRKSDRHVKGQPVDLESGKGESGRLLDGTQR